MISILNEEITVIKIISYGRILSEFWSQIQFDTSAGP